MSKTDRQLLRQKVRQRISVMKTNTGVFVVFKTKRELKGGTCLLQLYLNFSSHTKSVTKFFFNFDMITDMGILSLKT